MKRALIALTTVSVVAVTVWLGISLLQRGMNVAVGPNAAEAAEPARLPANLPARPLPVVQGPSSIDYDPARDPNRFITDGDYRYRPSNRAQVSFPPSGEAGRYGPEAVRTPEYGVRVNNAKVVTPIAADAETSSPSIRRVSGSANETADAFASDTPATPQPSNEPRPLPSKLSEPPQPTAPTPVPVPSPLPSASNNPVPLPASPQTSPAALPTAPSYSVPSSVSTPTAAPQSAAPQTAAANIGTGRPGPKYQEGPQAPSLIVEKSAPAEVQVGKSAKFSIAVRNVGAVAAHDVEIRDEVPAGTQLVATSPRANIGPRGELLWSVGVLKPNDEVTVTVEVLPVAEGELGSVATVRLGVASTNRTVSTRPELVLDVSSPREALIGETVTLSIRVSNPGTGIATGVVLAEQVPVNLEHPAGPELEHALGDLRPGETRELDLVMKAVRPGDVVNRLFARGEGQLQAMKESALKIVAPALEVALEGSRRRFLDRPSVYTISLSNPGTAPAQNVALATYLAPGMEFVEANNSGQFNPVTRSVHWLLEELPAKEVGKVTVTVQANEAGEMPLRIAGSAQNGLATEKREVIRVEGVAALVFQVLDLQDPIEVGGETTYEIRVTNQGSKVAENVSVLGMLPPEMKPLSAEGPARYEFAGQQFVFQPLAQLAPKAEAVYHVRVQALRQGDLKIAVQVKSADLQIPVTKEEVTRVFQDQ